MVSFCLCVCHCFIGHLLLIMHRRQGSKRQSCVVPALCPPIVIMESTSWSQKALTRLLMHLLNMLVFLSAFGVRRQTPSLSYSILLHAQLRFIWERPVVNVGDTVRWSTFNSLLPLSFCIHIAYHLMVSKNADWIFWIGCEQLLRPQNWTLWWLSFLCLLCGICHCFS